MLRSGLLPYKLHIRTSRSTVEGYLQAVTSRHVRTSHAGATVDKERHVTSRHVTSGRHRRRRGQGGRDVTSRHVTSRHVTSGRHRRCRGQGGRHVTSRPVRTSQAPPWTRRPSRHVTSRQDITGAAVDKEAVTSRHVTSRHDVRRPQSAPCSGDGVPIFKLWNYSFVTLRSKAPHSTFRFDRRSGRRSPPLHWAGRRWVRTFKRRFGISGRRLPLDGPVSADHGQAKAGSGPIFGTFFWPLSRRILFETTQILEPFWFLFLGRELYQVMAFYHLLDDLAAQVGPEKMHFVAECR